MRDATELIADIRSDANDSTTPYAVATADILRYMNWGNERMWGLILQTSPQAMQKEITFPSVANQREYEIPANVYMKERIVKVEYKETTNDRDYYRLKETKYAYYVSYPSHNPSAYVRRSGKLLPTPPIDNATGTFRVTYEAAPNLIKESAGEILSFTDDGTAITQLQLDTTTASVDAATLDYLCVTDVLGNSTMLNIGASSYNVGNGQFTLDPASHTYLTGETLAIGSKVTQGLYTSAASNLPTLCERYIVAYAVWKCMSRTTASPEKINNFRDEMKMVEDEIVRSFQEPDKDDDDVGIENSEVMLQDF